MRDVWQAADSYEAYVGRWSRPVARELVAQLAIPRGSVWLEIGCGTGALTDAILTQEPLRVHALDRSVEFVRHARNAHSSSVATFAVGDAVGLPWRSGVADVAVSGLVLNFVPDPESAVREMLRCVRPDGIVAVYLWDYAEGMQLIRMFWDAAVALNPEASQLDEAIRFPLCRPAALEELFTRAEAREVRLSSITVPVVFRDFEELWSPFLGGQGPAPTYIAGLSEEERAALRGHLRETLPVSADGAITLSARAWVIRGRRQSRGG